MSENKRYYFLQMPEDFFNSKRIKRLRHLAGGDTFTIIYLKMQLKAINNGGVLFYDGLMNSIAEEIAMDIDENTDNVQMTINYLQSCGLLEIRESGDCYLPYAEVNVGSITASSLRSRECRQRKNVALQQNNVALQQKSVALQQDSNTSATKCNGDIDIDTDTDLTISNDIVCQTQSVKRIIKEWNSLAKQGVKPISKLSNSSTRYRSLIARLNEYGEEEVLKAIENIRHSDYLQGKVKDWQITFDWFVKPNNFPKVLEGNYTNKNWYQQAHTRKLTAEEIRKELYSSE